MEKMKRNLLVLSVLVLIFSIPWMIAYQLSKHPEWMKNLHPTNYGTWVKQPVTWQEPVPNQRHWQLVLWQDKACTISCMKQLDLLGRVRLAMGRKVMLMNIWLYLPSDYPLTDEQMRNLSEHDILVAYANKSQQALWTQTFSKAPIVLFSPENKALLMYNSSFEPKKIYHDFQRLIK
jgi:hypothetical protein